MAGCGNLGRAQLPAACCPLESVSRFVTLEGLDMAVGYGKGWDPASFYKDDAIAGSYDEQRFRSLAGRVYNHLEKRLIRRAFADVPRGSTVVDVPCGTGRLAEVLLEEGFTVVGLDISKSMLGVARSQLRRFDRFRGQQQDAKALGKSGLQFEAALCARVLMHFPLPEQIEFLRNVAAVTRGRVVFTQGLDTPYHRLRRMLKRVLRHQKPAVYSLSPKEAAELISAAGLREIKRYRVLPGISEALVFVTEKRAPLS